MIREFLSPRVFLVFLVLWGLLAAAITLWWQANPTEHRRWWRLVRVPVLSAAGALVLVGLLITILNSL